MAMDCTTTPFLVKFHHVSPGYPSVLMEAVSLLCVHATGALLGAFVGEAVGALVGEGVTGMVGAWVGEGVAATGDGVGFFVGALVGDGVGAGVGLVLVGCTTNSPCSIPLIMTFPLGKNGYTDQAPL